MDYAPIASGKAVYANTGAGKNKAVKDEARFWKEFKVGPCLPLLYIHAYVHVCV